ncbi:MAG: DUF6122 family protein [Proteobacteria bacterium]|nr:DUF6122 family protein [Pseudomonadota bacterium]
MYHIFLHFLIPLFISLLFFKKNWKKAYIIMMLTMLVDLDHLLATPIYDAARCSIGFHPLHTLVPIGLYLVACFIPKIRYIGIGLIIHMILDSINCQITNGVWYT